MGNYFADLYIKKNEYVTKDALSDALTAYFAARGIIACDRSHANLSVIIDFECDSWIFAYCEAWGHEDLFALAPQLTEQFSTQVLSCACFDSDYLFLHLLGAQGVDAFLNIGKSAEIKPPRRTNLNDWKAYVKDFEAFKQGAKRPYVCVEDFLSCMQAQLSLPDRNTVCGQSALALYFSAPQSQKPALPVLRMHTPSLLPCRPDQPEYWSVHNTGGASKGIYVMFVGDWTESCEITLENVALCYQNARGERINEPLTLQNTTLQNGMPALIASLPDFKIPAAPSQQLPPKAYMEKEFARSFGVRFTPQGNERKFLDITVGFVPYANPVDGQCAWRVWAHHKTKKEFIQAHNQSALHDHQAWGVPLHLIDPDAYDLD